MKKLHDKYILTKKVQIKQDFSTSHISQNNYSVKEIKVIMICRRIKTHPQEIYECKYEFIDHYEGSIMRTQYLTRGQITEQVRLKILKPITREDLVIIYLDA